MSRSDKGGGSAARDQIGDEIGRPPSAYGISPARGEKRSFSKVSLRGKLPKAEGGSPLSLRHQLFRGFLGMLANPLPNVLNRFTTLGQHWRECLKHVEHVVPDLFNDFHANRAGPFRDAGCVAADHLHAAYL